MNFPVSNFLVTKIESKKNCGETSTETLYYIGYLPLPIFCLQCFDIFPSITHDPEARGMK